MKTCCFQTRFMYRSFMHFVETFDGLPIKRDCQCYIIPTLKNAAKLMVWGAISAKGRCGLWFILEGTSNNGIFYLDVLSYHRLWVSTRAHTSNTMEYLATRLKILRYGLRRSSDPWTVVWKFPGSKPSREPLVNF